MYFLQTGLNSGIFLKSKDRSIWPNGTRFKMFCKHLQDTSSTH